MQFTSKLCRGFHPSALSSSPMESPLQFTFCLPQDALGRQRGCLVGLHQPPSHLPQGWGVLLVRAIDHAAVQQVRDLVHLLRVAEGAAQLGSRHGPHEVHAPLAVLLVEGVVAGDGDGEALGVLDLLVHKARPVLGAALDAGGVGVCKPEERGVGEVVVHELPPLHHVVGVQLCGGVHVRHDVDGDEPG